MRGHLWTILPHLRDGIAPPRSRGVSWSTELEDPDIGRLRLTGGLDEVAGSDRLVIFVHGIGGNAGRGYMVRAAQWARSLGLSSLRLNLRGADNDGRDIYHAGLVSDLEAAVKSRELAHYKNLHAVGFSLGGHMVARYALNPDARMRSVAALCSPIDLREACEYIDRSRQFFYRRHLLVGLKRGAQRVRSSENHLLGDGDFRGIRRIRDWDNDVVAPRFGFRGADDYYHQVGVGRHLDALAIPSLFIFATGDPMVANSAIQPALKTRSSLVSVRQLPGGHVHIPAKLGALPDCLRWLLQNG
ncbi:MAG: alpha/beta fold hydrolase [Myxococcales bacterium]|nr:alpha/beta fold hydrolase [Myxococcales bacterium]